MIDVAGGKLVEAVAHDFAAKVPGERVCDSLKASRWGAGAGAEGGNDVVEVMGGSGESDPADGGTAGAVNRLATGEPETGRGGSEVFGKRSVLRLAADGFANGRCGGLDAGGGCCPVAIAAKTDSVDVRGARFVTGLSVVAGGTVTGAVGGFETGEGRGEVDGKSEGGGIIFCVIGLEAAREVRGMITG